jgi:hypothetical protein
VSLADTPAMIASAEILGAITVVEVLHGLRTGAPEDATTTREMGDRLRLPHRPGVQKLG